MLLPRQRQPGHETDCGELVLSAGPSAHAQGRSWLSLQCGASGKPCVLYNPPKLVVAGESPPPGLSEHVQTAALLALPASSAVGPLSGVRKD